MTTTPTLTTLVVPGLSSSGSAHWQTWLEGELPGASRVVQRDWKRPDLPEWSRQIRRAIVRQTQPVLIAAHSFGALAAVQAADDLSPHVAGLLLVAPADPDKFAAADVLPARRLQIPTIIVASTNDPWLGFDRAVALADTWRARLVDLGAAGHINADAGYGPWPLALELLAQLEREFAFTHFHHTRTQALIRKSSARSGLWRAFNAEDGDSAGERSPQKARVHGRSAASEHRIADDVRA
jgi:predicted alpha/beta hydrolase family esterase